MPYPNEHAARLKEPDQYEDFVRQNDRFGQGVDAIWGIKSGKPNLQALRFDKDAYTSKAAKKWLKDHKYETISFEAATEEKPEKKKPKKKKKKKSAGALYPSLVAPEDFRPGDVVRKIFSDFRVTEYLGIILAIHPTTQTVDVKWPYGIGFENPQDLIRVNPFYEPPTVTLDPDGYYSTWDAERWNSGTETATKGVSGESSLYHGSPEAIEELIKNAGNSSGSSITLNIDTIGSTPQTFTLTNNATNTPYTFTLADNTTNYISTVEEPEVNRVDRIANRYVRRVFNVLLKAASFPYNAGLNDLQTYSFLYKKFSKIYSEPSIRRVVSYLYAEPHTHAVEDFDLVIQAAVVAAQEKDKKLLKEMFLSIVRATDGDAGKNVNDLLDFSIETPHGKELYNNFRHAVRRGGGRLDLLPTPSARFASITPDKKAEMIVIPLTGDYENTLRQLFDFEDDFIDLVEISPEPFVEAHKKLDPKVAKLWEKAAYLEDKLAVVTGKSIGDFVRVGRILKAFEELESIKKQL